MGSLIGLDWGTSSLRAYRFDERGAIIDSRTRPWGIRHLPDGGFGAALQAMTDGWPKSPQLACGMVGSRNGWHEAPYLDLPSSEKQLANAIVSNPELPLSIVPGLRNANGPDVMRGEETQIFGGLAMRPALAPQSTWLLPGTHSKWVSVQDRRVTDFHTFMTGELFDLLRRHSILGAGLDNAEAKVADGQAFDRGVVAARDSGSAGSLSRLFSTRALMLDGALTSAEILPYLSGLLLGEELRAVVAGKRFSLRDPVQLIGETGLCANYRRAGTHFDIECADPLPDAAAHGLWQLAAASGLPGQDKS